MKNLLKNKRVIQILLIAAVLGLASTPAGRLYADQLIPLITQISAQ